MKRVIYVGRNDKRKGCLKTGQIYRVSEIWTTTHHHYCFISVYDDDFVYDDKSLSDFRELNGKDVDVSLANIYMCKCGYHSRKDSLQPVIHSCWPKVNTDNVFFMCDGRSLFIKKDIMGRGRPL